MAKLASKLEITSCSRRPRFS